MSRETKELYGIRGGDRWYLARDQAIGQPYVLHVSNASSGGHVERIGLGDFLAREGNAPEQQALMRLIGALVEGHSDADPA